MSTSESSENDSSEFAGPARRFSHRRGGLNEPVSQFTRQEASQVFALLALCLAELSRNSMDAAIVKSVLAGTPLPAGDLYHLVDTARLVQDLPPSLHDIVNRVQALAQAATVPAT